MSDGQISLHEPVNFDEILKFIDAVHSAYTQGRWFAIENANKVKDAKWFKATVSPTTIGTVKVDSPHVHDSGLPELMGVNDSMASAVQKYPMMRETGGDAADECAQRIEKIRTNLKNGEPIKSVILRWEKKDNSLWHIDGLHRMVALLLEDYKGAVPAYVAVIESAE